MAEMLKKNYDNTFNVVQSNEIKIGDSFYQNIAGKARQFLITNVYDQRKERGELKDESNRRMWARVAAELQPLP